jgi:hypothetical protein
MEKLYLMKTCANFLKAIRGLENINAKGREEMPSSVVPRGTPVDA